jgi:hypothetical protein
MWAPEFDTNECVFCVAAIQALVSLNEQISASLALPDAEEEPDFQRPSPRQLQDGGSVASRQQQAVDSSMALMRRLLVDAQVTTVYIISIAFPLSQEQFMRKVQVFPGPDPGVCSTGRRACKGANS